MITVLQQQSYGNGLIVTIYNHDRKESLGTQKFFMQEFKIKILIFF